MVNVLATLPSFISLVLASSHFKRDMRLHERRDGVPEGFTSKGPAPGNAALRLHIALVQNDIKGLQTKLMDVSTPSSSQYGQWLSKEEVGTFVTPKPETVTAVNEWLSANGLNATVLSPYGDRIALETTVDRASELLDAKFSTFVHDGSGKRAIRTLEYSIPASLKDHLELVHPTVAFPSSDDMIGSPIFSSPAKVVRRAGDLTSAVASSCDNLITPACLQQLYGIPTVPASQSSNRLAVSPFHQGSANKADLGEFLQTFRTDLSPNTTFFEQAIDGGSNPQAPSEAGIEANLDVQYTVGIASGVPTVLISVGNQARGGEPGRLLDLINFLLHHTELPQVLTTSYVWDENTISHSMANNLCNAFMQLGARGVSVLVSSGDGGVSGSQRQGCRAFVPTFPASCPYVTSVGATQNTNPEISATFSSGGFSNNFPTPAYQLAAKAAYLNQLGSTNAGRFNPSGRGFPDVAAAGTNLAVVWKGNVTSVEGTSGSSLVFASVVSLLNDRLIAAHRGPLGFLNPFLYSQGARALNDITTGNNPGCNTNGFPVKAGWDPVTGLGTPNWAKLLAAVGL
ncbi:family S53 protease [Lactarius indigo]|nr:family S53 protease [Lactarius indigo]